MVEIMLMFELWKERSAMLAWQRAVTWY